MTCPGLAAVFAIAALNMSTLTGSRAANGDRHLLADDPRHAPRYRVGFLTSDAAGHLNRLRIVHRFANRVRNLPCANLRLISADRIRYLLGDALGNHVTDPVADCLHPLLGNHMANLVDAGLDNLLRNHPAGLVNQRLDSLLVHHVTNLVDTSLDTGFRNHMALAVGDGLDAGFGDHVAYFVGTNLGSRFRNIAANRIGHRVGYRVMLIADTVDDFGVDLGNPDLFADLAGWALHGYGVRLAGHVNAAATAGIPRPAAGLLHALVNDRARHFGDLRFPATTADLNRLRVRNWAAHRAADLSIASFINRFADIVADCVAAGFPNRLADRVVHVSRASFPNWLVDGVANILGSRLPDRRTNRVADIFGMGIPDRRVLGVANVFGTRLPDGCTNRVANLFGTGLPDRFADVVRTCLVVRLVHRLLDRVLARLIVRLRHVADTVNRLAIVNGVIYRLVASVLFLLVNHFTTGLHHGVALLLSSVIFGWMNSSTMTVTGRAKIGRGRRVDRCEQHQSRDHRHTPERFHVVPFLLLSGTGVSCFVGNRHR